MARDRLGHTESLRQFQNITADLFDRFPELVGQADEVLGYSLKELCLEDSSDNLKNTQYTQPALYAVNVLTYLAALEDGAPKPDTVVGHSLGEYSALFAAGVYDFVTGLKLVQKRGALMSKATGGGMAALLGMDGDATKKALAELSADSIDVANFNSPRQTVISGMKEDIEEVAPKLQDMGAKRAVVLSVSGAFHSRYMQSAADEFKSFVSGCDFNAPTIPCIANCSAKPYELATIGDNMVNQIVGSVLWVDTIRQLKESGEVEFVEMGPGKVLTSLVRQLCSSPPRLDIEKGPERSFRGSLIRSY